VSIFTIFPSLLIMTVCRLPGSAPSACATFPSGSERSGYVSLLFSLNFFCSSGVSRETPMIA